MTSKIWHQRAVMLGLASLAALPLSASRANELRTTSRAEVPAWSVAAREQPGSSAADFSARADKAARRGSRRPGKR